MMTAVKKTTEKEEKTALKRAPKSAAPADSKEFAVIATGGKQYVVTQGISLKVEIMPGEFKEGDKITFDKVLIVDNGTETTIGTPYISGAKVMGTLLSIGRNQKVETIKYKQKSRYFVRRGHRQQYFLVKIESIK